MGTEAAEKKEEKIEVSKEELDKILRNHMYSAFGVGLIPLPLVDLLAVTGIQLNMVRKLAKAYDFPFSKEKIKNIISSLVGGAVPASVGPSVASLAKVVPIVGYSLGAVSMSVLSAASTYAIGKVFIRHFDSGGGFLTLNTDKVKEYYNEMFKKGKKVASDIEKETKADKEEKATETKADKKTVDSAAKKTI